MFRVASALAIAALAGVAGTHAQSPGISGGGQRGDLTGIRGEAGAAPGGQATPDPRDTPQKDVVPCTDARYKAAEDAAYKALLKAQADAARALEDAITAMEKTLKDDLASEDSRYRGALTRCGANATCIDNENTFHAPRPNHILATRDASLRFARADESAAIQRAKKEYEEAVAKAVRDFCQSKEAPTGDANPALKAAEVERLRQALMRLAQYAATIR